MKASHKSPHSATSAASFQPDPLTPEQLHAIDLLIERRTDQETADLIGRDRATVWRWKTRTPFFAATLEARRQEVFGVALQRLRHLLSKAIDNITGAIQAGDVKASFDLVKATGLHGFAPPTGETNVQVIAERIMLEIIQREHIPQSSYDLIDVGKNPRYAARQQELLDALARGDAVD